MDLIEFSKFLVLILAAIALCWIMMFAFIFGFISVIASIIKNSVQFNKPKEGK